MSYSNCVVISVKITSLSLQITLEPASLTVDNVLAILDKKRAEPLEVAVWERVRLLQGRNNSYIQSSGRRPIDQDKEKCLLPKKTNHMQAQVKEPHS